MNSDGYICARLSAVAGTCTRGIEIETLLKGARNMVGFLEFARTKQPAANGDVAAVAIAESHDRARQRGESAPNASMRALTVFNEALELNLPLKNPAVEVEKTDNKKRKQMRPPMGPPEFIIKLEEIARDKSKHYGLRLFCASFLLQVFASLRFSDAVEIETMRRTKASFCGRCVGQKGPAGPHIVRAAVRLGIHPNGARIDPVVAYWGNINQLAPNIVSCFSIFA